MRRRKAIAALAASFIVGSANADAVTDWNAIMERTVTTVDPFLQGRSAAIMHVAVFEAVNAIVGDYEPYLGCISAPNGASADAAAVAAAHRVLATLHPDAALELDAARSSSLAQILDGPAKRDGIAVGEGAADAILRLRANDGSDVEVPYTPGSAPGDYRPTPPDFTPAFRPGLGRVMTFGIESGAQFRVPPPPRLRSKRYARDYEEVKRFGDVNSSERSAHFSDVAVFYAFTDAVALYSPAARQVSAAQGKTLSENARLFALMTMAIFDGAVAVFDSKYVYNFWRPVTAIPLGDEDGNRRTAPDADWLPLVFTPPFPSYPSGHAGFGAAARRVLEVLLGVDGLSITLTNPQAPGIELHYTSWKQITDDVDDGRVFGGVHYRFDQEAAARQGRRVGSYILEHQLRPVHRRQRELTKARTPAVDGTRPATVTS